MVKKLYTMNPKAKTIITNANSAIGLFCAVRDRVLFLKISTSAKANETRINVKRVPEFVMALTSNRVLGFRL